MYKIQARRYGTDWEDFEDWKRITDRLQVRLETYKELLSVLSAYKDTR